MRAMITKDQIRDYLDKLRLSTRLDNDGDIVFSFNPDDDFGYPVVVTIVVENGFRVSFMAGAVGYEPAGDPLFLANRNNARRNYPTAVVRDGHVRMEYSVVLREEVSDDYIMHTVLGQTLSSIWSAYVDLEKETV